MPDQQKIDRFLKDFVRYLQWRFDGGKKPTMPTVAFKALLEDMGPGKPQLRKALLRSMRALQETGERVVI